MDKKQLIKMKSDKRKKEGKKDEDDWNDLKSVARIGGILVVECGGGRFEMLCDGGVWVGLEQLDCAVEGERDRKIGGWLGD